MVIETDEAFLLYLDDHVVQCGCMHSVIICTYICKNHMSLIVFNFAAGTRFVLTGGVLHDDNIWRWSTSGSHIVGMNITLISAKYDEKCLVLSWKSDLQDCPCHTLTFPSICETGRI